MTNKFQCVIGVACAFLVTSVFCVNPSYALTIDQNTNTGSLQVQYHEPLGQSFTATDTDIGYAGLNIEPYNQNFNDLSLTMSLYSGAGDFSAGSLLTSNSFTLVEGYSGWLNLDVSTVSFTQNAEYTIGIFNDTPQWGVSINWNDNPYSGGVAYSLGSANLNADLQFHVGPGNVSSVPEPSTLLLISSGLVGLGFARRKLKA